MSRTENESNFDPDGEGDLLADALDALSEGNVSEAQVLALMAIAEAVRDVVMLLDVEEGEGREGLRLPVEEGGDQPAGRLDWHGDDGGQCTQDDNRIGS